jgi:putative DNA primase/helicase
MWGLQKYAPAKNGGKPGKVPYRVRDPSHKARVNVTRDWVYFDAATAAFENGGFDGVNFLLADLIGAFDLDDCIDPAGGIAAWAQRFLDESRSTYAERTPSGTDLRIMGYSASGGNAPSIVPSKHLTASVKSKSSAAPTAASQ